MFRPKILSEQGYARLPGKDSDDSADETELFIRKTTFQEIPTVEKVVGEGDTLQALSIRYHCPIAEIKRLNNIHRENEIFAKRIIKVPARTFTTALASVHISGSTSPNEKLQVHKGVDPETLKLKLADNLLNTPSVSGTNGTTEVNQIIFNSNVKPGKICDNTIENPIIEYNEEVRLLPSMQRSPENVVTRLSCSGADADISWITLIVCGIILIVAVPLIYVFYIAEHLEEFHHSHFS